MVNQELKEWIAKARKKGLSDAIIRNELKKSGYQAVDIDNALREDLAQIFLKSIKPNIFKLIIPVIFVILSLVALAVNTIHFPPAAQGVCSWSETMDVMGTDLRSFDKATQQLDADADEIAEMWDTLQEKGNANAHHIQSISRDHFLPIALANVYVIYYALALPLPYHLPCEATIVFEGKTRESPECGFYSTQEDYNCIKRFNYEFILGNYPPAYKPISKSRVFLDTLLVALFTYFVACLFVFVYYAAHPHYPLKFGLVSALLMFLAVSKFWASPQVFAIWAAPLMFLACCLFMGESSTKKTAKAVLLLVLIGMLTGIAVINHKITEDVSRTVHETHLHILPCVNQDVLNSSEIQDRGVDAEFANETWNVCVRPDCEELCYQKCGGSSLSLRGSNPTCLCAC